MTNPQSTDTTTLQPSAGFPPVEEDSALQLAYAIAAAADERKGGNITLVQVGDVSYLADYFVIVTGFSTVQVRAITRSIEATLEDDYNRRPPAGGRATGGQLDFDGLRGSDCPCVYARSP